VTDPTVQYATSLAGKYVKQYAAGAFAFPTRKELEEDPTVIREWDGVVAVAKELSRDSGRRDFTGAPFTLKAGSTVYTHIIREPNADLSSLALGADYIIAYLDDLELCNTIRANGYSLLAATVSASSELKGVFHLGPEHDYPAWDLATTTPIPLNFSYDESGSQFDDMVDEASGLAGFRDDWPLYSDGSWGALCLKGFYPDDPGRDMKPLEMNKKWQAEHPEDLDRTCEWTSLAADCPSLMEFVTSVPWWSEMERVRLLQMSGRNGKCAAGWPGR
jgi:hypothetical protein